MPKNFGLDFISQYAMWCPFILKINDNLLFSHYFDDMKVGDKVVFYHSSAKPSGAAGVMTVTQAGYPDPSQFHPEHRHYDPIATIDEPRWYMVDVSFEQAFTETLPLSALKFIPALEDSLLLKKGCEQLTVIPLAAKHWQAIMDMAETLDLLANE